MSVEAPRSVRKHDAPAARGSRSVRALSRYGVRVQFGSSVSRDEFGGGGTEGRQVVRAVEEVEAMPKPDGVVE